jgi:hypothetical protein
MSQSTDRLPDDLRALRGTIQRAFSHWDADLRAMSDESRVWYEAQITAAESRILSTVSALTEERDALKRQVADLDMIGEATARERDEWREAAIDLGVNGKQYRDDTRKQLCLNMRVDAKLLELGGIKVLDSTLNKMRDDYKASIPKDPAQEIAAAFAESFANVERNKRRAGRSPEETP